MPEPTEDEIYEADLAAELEKWNAISLAPENLQPAGGLFKIVVMQETIKKVLIDAEVCTEEEFTRAFRHNELLKLAETRKELEPQAQQAKLDAIKNGRLRRQ